MKNSRRLRNPVILIAVALLSALLAACGSASSGGMPDQPQVAPPERPAVGDGGAPEQGGDPGSDGDTGGEGRMIIRSKVLRLEVGSTTEAIASIRELTRTHAGTVTDMQVATDSEEWIYHYDELGYPVGDGTALRGWITVRVPTEAYEEFVDDVSGLGVIRYQSESTEDVTQEHVDLSARLANLRAQEERLREFFDAATDVEDMLAIEKELSRVRGEIESMDAQVKFLERQAAMATVTLELTEPQAVVRPDGGGWGFRDAITDGFRGAAGVLTSLLTLLIATSPIWVLAGLLFFPIRALVRRRRTAASSRMAPASSPAQPPTPPDGPPPDGPPPDSTA